MQLVRRGSARISTIRGAIVSALLTVVLAELAHAMPVEVGSAPENGLQLTVSAIRSARRSLRVNIYEMKSEMVGDALVEKIEEGLHVEILNEGQPVGGLSDKALEIRRRIIKAMRGPRANRNDRFYVMQVNENSEKGRRFRFDHAKYTIVDESRLLIGSENYSAPPPTSSKPGNRGWQVVIHDPAVTHQYGSTFENDVDPRNDDIRELVGDRSDEFTGIPFALGTAFAASLRSAVQPALDSLRDSDHDTLDATRVDRIISPDTSLQGLVQLLDEARESIDLELMTFSPRWGSTGQRSPLLAATLRAARRGVKVRVLLNDETVFGGGRSDDAADDESSEASPLDSKPKNPETVEILNRAAEEEGLKLEGRICDVKAMGVSYIHNKGALLDGRFVLVSSINWNQNAVENNREAAVVLDGKEIHQHYRRLFDKDWKASADIQ